MYGVDTILNDAWDRVSLNTQIKLSDTINLLDQIEAILGKPIISNEYRSFWIDTVLSNPGLSVTKSDFKELFKKLFNMRFADALYSTERNRDNLTKQMTDSIVEETTNIKKLQCMDDDEKINEYSKRIRLLQDALETRDIYGGSKYLDHSTELAINQKLVKYLSALNEVYKHYTQKVSSKPSFSQYVEKLSSGISKQEELLKSLDKKFDEHETSSNTGWLHIKNVNLNGILTKLFILAAGIMITSYGLSLLAEEDDGYASYYYEDNKSSL